VAVGASGLDALYLRDLAQGATVRLPTPPGARVLTPVLASDGASVVFLAGRHSDDPLEWLDGAHPAGFDLVRLDLGTGATRTLRGAIDGYDRPAVSADGRYVAFIALGPFGLLPNPQAPAYGIARWDTRTDMALLATPGPHGLPEGFPAQFAAISPEGAHVAFAHLDAEEYGLGLASITVELAGDILLGEGQGFHTIREQVWLVQLPA
jgi:hypothetical protein